MFTVFGNEADRTATKAYGFITQSLKKTGILLLGGLVVIVLAHCGVLQDSRLLLENERLMRDVGSEICSKLSLLNKVRGRDVERMSDLIIVLRKY